MPFQPRLLFRHLPPSGTPDRANAVHAAEVVDFRVRPDPGFPADVCTRTLGSRRLRWRERERERWYPMCPSLFSQLWVPGLGPLTGARVGKATGSVLCLAASSGRGSVGESGCKGGVRSGLSLPPPVGQEWLGPGLARPPVPGDQGSQHPASYLCFHFFILKCLIFVSCRALC